MASKLERNYQPKLIEKINELLPGCIVTKVDGFQGIPDLLVLYHDRYALLEVKKAANAKRQPNQDYYVDFIKSWGAYSSFVYPENEEMVLRELQQALQPRRKARISKR